MLRRYAGIKPSMGTRWPDDVRKIIEARDPWCVGPIVGMPEDCYGTSELDHVRASGGIGMKSRSTEPVTNRENVLRGVGLSATLARRTHCPKGHPFSGPNLIIIKKGTRLCRTCYREYRIARRLRRLGRLGAAPVAPGIDRLPVVARCAWVFKSGWAKGNVCGSDAWTVVDGEPRCSAHDRRPDADQPEPHGSPRKIDCHCPHPFAPEFHRNVCEASTPDAEISAAFADQPESAPVEDRNDPR